MDDIKQRFKKIVTKKRLFQHQVLAIGVSMVMMLIYLFGSLETFQYSMMDKIMVYNSGGKQDAHDDIHYIIIPQSALNITERIYSMGWPWKRAYYGKVLDFLSYAGAKLIAFDMIFTEGSVYSYEEKNYAKKLGLKMENLKTDDQTFASKLNDRDVVLASSLSAPKSTLSHEKIKAYTKRYRKDIDRFGYDIELKDDSVDIPEYMKFIPVYNVILEKLDDIGIINIDSDEDGLYRRFAPFFKYDNKYYPSLALASAIKIMNLTNFRIEDGHLIADKKTPVKVMKDYFRMPLSSSGHLRLKFHGSGRGSLYPDFNIVYIALLHDMLKAFYDGKVTVNNLQPPDSIVKLFSEDKWTVKLLEKVASNKQNFDALGWGELGNALVTKIKKINLLPSNIEDKIFLVAGIAPGLYDKRGNPFDPDDAGAHIHATMLDNILQQDFLSDRFTDFYAILFIILMSFIAVNLLGIVSLLVHAVFNTVAALWNITGQIFTAILLSFFTLLAINISYSNFNTIYDPVTPLMTILFSFIATTLFTFVIETKQKSFIKDAFGQYISPKVVDQLLLDPTKLQLGGQQKSLTAIFTDLAGFTSISESLEPSELVELLNEYLSEMCVIIERYHGTVDKFEGDAIIAFWGAPIDAEDHAIKACTAVVEMQKKVFELRQKFKEAERPEIYMRVGINTGSMVVGNLGSSKRMDYTIMGDSVNLSARLEPANKVYGTYTMLSQFTYDLAKDYIEVRPLDKLLVVGKKEAVQVYELLDLKGQLNPSIHGAVTEYLDAYALYGKRDFEGAKKHFEKALKLSIENADYITPGPSKLYLDRCEAYIKNPPPEDWNGVFALTSKG